MEFTLQKQNKHFIVIAAAIIFLIIFIPLSLGASIYDYNPDIDIALGDYRLIIHDNSNFTISGSYLGILYMMESPLLKNLFSTTNFYGIYNFGAVFLNDKSNDTILFLPIFVDIGYKFQLLKKFEVLPFAGWGLGIIPKDYPETKKAALLSINIGLLIRYRLWKTTYLKLRIEYGTIFGKQFPDRGYANYFRIVYPIPFIP